MRVNTERLWDDLEQLGTIGHDPRDGGITRIAFSPQDMEAREFIKGLITSTGMQVSVDAVGNVIGSLKGELDAPAIAVGSHLDTVISGGRFDGTVGVLAGVECARVIRESCYPLKHPIEVIAFSDEEGTRFGRGTLGSRALAGFLDPADFHALKDRDGATLWQVLSAQGFAPERAELSRRAVNSYLSYLELHIEQGPVLAASGISIGIVESIAGILRHQLKIEGESNHAGTTPMSCRRDALVVAARGVGMVPEILQTYGEGMVGTVGRFEISPGVPNVIPGLALMTIELRGRSQSKLDQCSQEILREVRALADRSGLSLEVRETVRTEPMEMNSRVIQTIEKECHDLGVSYRRMNSGAGHDAIWMAKNWPTGMLFVPSADGISHGPREFTDPLHVTLGAQVLLNTILSIDQWEG